MLANLESGAFSSRKLQQRLHENLVKQPRVEIKLRVRETELRVNLAAMVAKVLLLCQRTHGQPVMLIPDASLARARSTKVSKSGVIGTLRYISENENGIT
jgi:hypothetical protein